MLNVIAHLNFSKRTKMENTFVLVVGLENTCTKTELSDFSCSLYEILDIDTVRESGTLREPLSHLRP